jgi:transposase
LADQLDGEWRELAKQLARTPAKTADGLIAKLAPPAYSCRPPARPTFHPIEQVFAKMKTLPRKADAATVSYAWRPIDALLDHFTCADELLSKSRLSPLHADIRKPR